jgi:TetR/AcrR family transcriptional regulator, tetracycline repressor protein
VAQQNRLSKDRILETALQIAADEGVDALSMRRLAQALDVWPMSLYGYFADKDALLDAMAAQSAARVKRPNTNETWQEQLNVLLSEAQKQIATSPGVAARIPNAFLEAEPLQLSETALQILVDAGFPPREAASAWRTLWSYTYGFATFRLAPTEAEAARRVRAATAALPEEDYPAITEAGSDLAQAFARDDEFDAGLARLLAGLTTQLARTV